MPDGTKMFPGQPPPAAAQMAGLKEIPVAYHPPGESFPIERNPVDPKTGKQAFELSKSIRRLNGKLVVGGRQR